MRSWLVSGGALGVVLAGCGGAAPRELARMPGPSAIRYEVMVASAEPWVLDVYTTFEGSVERGALPFPPAVRDVVVEEAGVVRRPETYGRAWKLGCKTTCSVRYKVDLSSAAELTEDSPSVAVRSGGDVLALGATWLMRPEPVDARVKVTLHVDTHDPLHPEGEPYLFAAPWPKGARRGDFEMVARDIGALGYAAFGRFVSFEVGATKGTADVVVLRGARAADDRAIEGWITATAHAMDAVYGRFPIERVMIAVVPVAGSSEVAFGRTVPAGGASIVVFVGDRAESRELFDDWVLAHEMFHLGIPSMPRGGAWLDEGFATYFEPLLRTRAGLLPERAVWAEFSRNMARGVATEEAPRLVATDDHDRVYYGGSLFALAADVEIRRRTRGARSLDDGLRRVLDEGGKATDVWTVEELVAALDRGAGVPVVRELFERVSAGWGPCGPAFAAGKLTDLSGCAPDDPAVLAHLFGALGVRAGTSEIIELDEAAPLAGVRRGIGAVDVTVAANVARSAPRDRVTAGAGRAKAGVEKP